MSLSLASVLVISVKSLRFSPKVFAPARARLALGLRRALHQVQRGLERQRLAVHLEAQARHRLVEQAVEGGSRRLRLFEEQLFQLVVQLIGLLLPEVLDPRAVMGECRNLHRRFEGCILDAVQLEFEEQQQRGDLRELGGNIAIELAALRIRRVAHIIELRIGAGAAQEIGNRLIVLQRLRQFPSAKRGELAAVFFREGLRQVLALLHVGCKFRRIRSGIEIGEVPFGKGSEVRGGGRCHVLSFTEMIG
jgi:hypothetical protein